MKVFDFNIHLPSIYVGENINSTIKRDLTLDSTGIVEGLKSHIAAIKHVDKVNFQLFNTCLFDNEVSDFIQTAKSYSLEYTLTALTDFRRPDFHKYLLRAKAQGVQAIMFNSYIQHIATADFEQVLMVCKSAEELGMTICVDGSYGTAKMFEYENIKLACYLADRISRSPIVIVHSGGYNVLQAMLLALDKPNVWLDTSFSLPYYIGSSLEIDFAFAFKKMDYKRVVFGSDNPYMNIDDCVQIHQTFFEKYNFPASAIEDIFYNNAKLLFK